MNTSLSRTHLLFRNAPTQVNIFDIDKITDIGLLIRLEKEYDEFIENETDLRYYDNVLEECLEMRDAIKIHLDRCMRMDLLYKYYGLNKKI